MAAEISKGQMFHALDDIGYVKFIDAMGSDETIVEAARMSTAKGFLGWGDALVCQKCLLNGSEPHTAITCHEGQAHDFKTRKGDEHLLEFLYKNNHHTPFEMCELAIEVAAPIFVFREWQRHRTQSFNEFSARYSQMPNEHYVPALERFETKQTKNKQESSANSPGTYVVTSLGWQGLVTGGQQETYDSYEMMLTAGVPREVARINTPVSRYSKMRAKTDLRNWLGFLKLRLDSSAQWEIRQYAEVVAKIISTLWPRTWALFEEYTLGAVTLSRSEAKLVAEWVDSNGAATTSRDAVNALRARLERK